MNQDNLPNAVKTGESPQSVQNLRQYRQVSNLSIQPLSPLDGRYRAAVSDLGFHLSEAGLNRARIEVEIEWLIHLANRDLLHTGTPVSEAQAKQLRDIVLNFVVAKERYLEDEGGDQARPLSPTSPTAAPRGRR
jgi:hypothetical protein